MSDDKEWRICAQRVRRHGVGPWLAEIREYDNRPGSRFVAEMTPEDAERVIRDRRRVRELTAALEAIRDFDRSLGDGFVDEWQEAIAFDRCVKIAEDALRADAAPAGREP